MQYIYYVYAFNEIKAMKTIKSLKMVSMLKCIVFSQLFSSIFSQFVKINYFYQGNTHFNIIAFLCYMRTYMQLKHLNLAKGIRI